MRCPVHGIPDCSPILNGCSIPNQIVAAQEAAVAVYKRTAIAELEANFSDYVWLPQVLAVLEDSP